jgi:hypothetical protein
VGLKAIHRDYLLVASNLYQEELGGFLRTLYGPAYREESGGAGLPLLR